LAGAVCWASAPTDSTVISKKPVNNRLYINLTPLALKMGKQFVRDSMHKVIASQDDEWLCLKSQNSINCVGGI